MIDTSPQNAGSITVRYLVDGNNVLHAARSHGPMRAIGRDVLCRLVARWARDRGIADVTVVFDGPVPRGDLARQIEQPGLTVQFSGSRSADEIIEDQIARAATPGQITVVTSDRAIQHAARYRRGRCIDSAQFLVELCAEPAEPQPAPDPPEKPQQVSTTDTQEWLDEFGPDPSDAADDGEMMD